MNEILIIIHLTLSRKDHQLDREYFFKQIFISSLPPPSVQRHYMESIELLRREQAFEFLRVQQTKNVFSKRSHFR